MISCSNLVASVKDKGDVKILPESDACGVIYLGKINKELTNFEIYIQNKSKRKFAFGYVVRGSATKFHVETTSYKVTVTEAVEKELGAFKQIPVSIEITAHDLGIINVALEFWFKCDKEETFHITKFIKAKITRRSQPYGLSVAELRKRMLTQR